MSAVIVLGVFLPLSSLLHSQAKTQWGGSSDSQWWNSANWSAGVPTPSLDVLISESAPLVNDVFVPVPMGTDTAQIMNLALSNGGVLRFEPSAILLVWGNDKLQNLGAVYLGDGTIIFKNKMTFHNGGTFDSGSGTLSFEGVTWESKSGSSFLSGTSSVVFNKPSDQSLIVDSSLNLTFYDLILNTQGTVTFDGTVSVQNSLTIAEGCTLNVPTGSSLFVEGEIINNGTVVGGGTYPGALPVQMILFTAASNRLDAILRWTTATEVDNFGFEIERRVVSGSQLDTQNPGLETPWRKIGFVSGSGISSSPREYMFIDAKIPAGRYAYRLRQVDRGGAGTFFAASEIEVGAAPKELSLGENYPNPFNPSTSIEFTFPEEGKASLKVFNMIGEEIATLFDNTTEAGRLYRATFSASSLPSGLYFYRLEFGKQSIVKRMMLVK